MYRNERYLVTLVLAGLLLTAASCASGNLDDADSADVVLEVQTTTIPPIAAAVDAGTGACAFTVTNASVTLSNRPKNSGADQSPFNDVILDSVVIAYAWDDGAVTPAATFALGANVPANGTGSVQFAPIAATELIGRDGHSASLDMLFVGRTVSGDTVTADGGGTLVVNSCI